MAVRIMWFRRDLRLSDNAALAAAASCGDTLLATASAAGSAEPDTVAGRWHRRCVDSLEASLRDRGCGLLVLDDATAELPALAHRCGATVVHCSRDWTPAAMAEEAAVREALTRDGVSLEAAEGQLLVPPHALATSEGRPYRVFAAFFRAWLGAWRAPQPLAPPERITGAEPGCASAAPGAAVRAGDQLDGWWSPGEGAALERLESFAEGPVLDYERLRDVPALRATSELSPYLSVGALAPAQVMRSLSRHREELVLSFVRQLAWREFAYHVLHHFPDSATRPLRQEFEAFPWRADADALEAWTNGTTGYPLVDAGMRQLARTGWMHNRVRLVCGSFLTKDLLVPWQIGEAHFRRELIDFDPAVNAFNWQWVAGSGADAAPYFRILNPMTQARRFDADGDYVERWLHAREQRELRPVVDHAEARERALAAYAAVKDARRSRRG